MEKIMEEMLTMVLITGMDAVLTATSADSARAEALECDLGQIASRFERVIETRMEAMYARMAFGHAVDACRMAAMLYRV
jgi:hypothetical protein